MIYHAIGLMSGSSLDGLDIASVRLTEQRGAWSYEVLAAACIGYDESWTARLRTPLEHSLQDFLELHTAYGAWLGIQVKDFIARHNLDYQVHFVASHGHTAYHRPGTRTSFQLGCGAALAAACGLPVISDLRAMDVAYGGQGAPIVPIGDRLLFGDYGAWLNLGGIVNISLPKDNGITAFDIAPCNQVLNKLAEEFGKPFDHGGDLAREGAVSDAALLAIRAFPYFSTPPPKSLANEFSGEVLPLLKELVPESKNALATYVRFIAEEISGCLPQVTNSVLLATGGGALNTFLIEEIATAIDPKGWKIYVPDEQTVQYKEAIVMALLGALRWREEPTVLATVTGARQDSIGGALWLPG